MTHAFRQIGGHYRTGSHDLIRDFYRPCLEVATSYDRAVGYFTSTSLSAAAKGLRPFLLRPGTIIRLVASPVLTEEDAQAIADGFDVRAFVQLAVDRELQRAVPDAVAHRLELLTWLIAHGRLELKLALVRTAGRVGIYHEKLGIFSDGNDTVVFTGSANESASGLLANFESLEIFRSWVPGESERVERRTHDFERLWANATPGLEVLEFPEAARRRLLEMYPASDVPPPGDDTDEDAPAKGPAEFRTPKSVELHAYQKDAIRAWWSAGGRGIWEMATGTGKTITALAGLSKLWEAYRSDHSMLILVTVPYQHLADQWAEEAKRFGMEPILCYDGQATWSAQLDAALATMRGSRGQLVFVVAVNATFTSDSFQDRLRAASGLVAFVSDEAHTAGSNTMRKLLPDSAKFRLGLSATPDRHLDPTGTSAIRDYFGNSVYELDLKKAIALGALVPYRYYPIVVELTEDELTEYVELTQKIVAALGSSKDVDPDNMPSSVDLLLFKRARLVGSAANKIPALRRAIAPFRGDSHTLVYCADRTGTNPQLNQVLAMLGKDLGIRANTFTAEENRQKRVELLSRFESGDLQALVAIRCLDEGVDIPATRRAFILASSQNPRQFVQRRGRVLRRSIGKDSAEVFDFLVSPPDFSDDPATRNLERKLVGRELIRAVELCDAATNTMDALTVLRPLRQRYDLMNIVPGL